MHDWVTSYLEIESSSRTSFNVIFNLIYQSIFDEIAAGKIENLKIYTKKQKSEK